MKKSYKQITFRENVKRINLLENIKHHLETYLKNLNHHNMSEGLSENVIAKRSHKEISKLISEACSYIEATSEDSNNYSKQNPDIHDKNILHRCYICSTLRSNSEEAIAIYKNDSRRAKQRTYCPFFWIILIIECLFVDYIVPLKKISQYRFFKCACKCIKYILYILFGGFLIFIVNELGWFKFIYEYFNKTIKPLLQILG